MAKRIGILTSGGDCPGLNAAIRGVAKASYHLFGDAEIVGITDGFGGLINAQYRTMGKEEFSGILTLGGTILRTSRQGKATSGQNTGKYLDTFKAMAKNYEKMQLDCLVVLGGNGTHAAAGILALQGLNIVVLPKTIDNDIFGTEVTFGYQSAVNIATDVIDRVHTTAISHSRVLIVELMGNTAGWLTLSAGLAGGADVILLPEIPYTIGSIADVINDRYESGKHFSIIAIAEGARSVSDDVNQNLKGKHYSVGYKLADDLLKVIDIDIRVVVPGHYQRGGAPCPYDRVLATQIGVHAAKLIEQHRFGRAVAVKNGVITSNKLSDVAGKTKTIPLDAPLLDVGRNIGISFGEA
ncbi:MAG: ATP-dependent 6-phosphofructokinase [Eubacteriales bacterium]|nr:ATP-dependent 6-phosphofructokinase [Eubacteriales bacterium]